MRRRTRANKSCSGARATRRAARISRGRQTADGKPSTTCAGAEGPGQARFCLTSKDADKTTGITTDAAAIKLNLRELGNKASHYGGTLVMNTNFLPSGVVQIGLETPFVPDVEYYAYLVLASGTRSLMLKHDNDVRAWKATQQDALVKNTPLKVDQTVISLIVPDDWAFAWRDAKLFVFTCQKTPNDPDAVSSIDTRVSPATVSATVAWSGVILLYLLAAAALGWDRRRHGLLTFLNPVRMTAGLDGKGSLGKLQILFFSLIVFGLITLFLVRTGLLTEISTTVLTLLGIAGVGSTAAKGADINRTTISTENKAYLMRKTWLPATGLAVPNTATWRDLFSTDGEFDVYRYQSFIFSLAVGGALLAGGVAQLSSFEIPTTLLEILGLSQAVYIGGKLVTPTSMSELNTAVGNMCDAEQKYIDAATAANQNTLPTNLMATNTATQPSFNAYMRTATDARTLFTTQTGFPVTAAQLVPTL